MSAGARIALAVKPGSSRPGIAAGAAGDTFVLRVRERAVEGAANEARVRALAEILGVARSNVALVGGASSRTKRFAIAGLAQETAMARLRAACEGD